MCQKKNVFSNKILKIICSHSYEKRIVMSVYKYFDIINPKKISSYIQSKLKKYDVLGRIYISTEGINAQFSVPQKNINDVIYIFRNIHFYMKNVYINFSVENNNIAFWKLKIKIKKQILSSGKINIPIFHKYKYNTYVDAFKVNKLFFDPDVIFVDMRNIYEYEIGHFKNALVIPSKTFREQLYKLKDFLLSYKKKKIIMYCTGGIRCEKSVILLKKNGFKKVYQIKGGILGYINQARKNNLPIYFLGKIFVFDERLSEKVTNDIFSFCKNCNKLTDNLHINCKNNYCHKLFIQCNSCSKKFKSFCSIKCKNL